MPQLLGARFDDDGDGLIDSDDPDCQLFCPYGDCFADACGPGYICGYDGCCTPHCNDGVVDGSESDVDCGGAKDDFPVPATNTAGPSPVITSPLPGRPSGQGAK